MIKKLFHEIEMTWPRVIIFAVAAGILGALMAMFVPDGNSFHEIAVSLEIWILFAVIIISNCATPVDAALKTFVFFLISQPLIYLIQVPFNSMGFGLFMYYKYWFYITLLTLPGAFIGWYIKRNDVFAGIILSVMLVLLIFLGIGYLWDLKENFPSHLVSTIFCFALVPFLIYGVFNGKKAILASAAISAAAFLFLMGAKTGVLPIPVFGDDTKGFMKTDFVELDETKYPLDDSWEITSENEEISSLSSYSIDEGKPTLYILFKSSEPNIFTLKDGSGNEYRLRISLDDDHRPVVEELDN